MEKASATTARRSTASSRSAELVEVAVPVPLRQALVYLVPEAFASMAKPGARARVPVGKRRLTGVILGEAEEAPAGVGLKELEAVVDLEPVVPEDLLKLGRFVADYYLAPIGEVFRTILPPSLEPWGDRRIWLTDKGALGEPRSEGERALLELVREQGRMSLAEAQRVLGRGRHGRHGQQSLEGQRLPQEPSEQQDQQHQQGRRGSLDGALDAPPIAQIAATLADRGWLAMGTREGRGSRYLTAIELVPGELDDLLERCGRSAPAKEVVRYLSDLGRPATSTETLAAVGCSAGVLRRLHSLGIIRRFSQIETLGMNDHVAGEDTDGNRGTPHTLRPDQSAAASAIFEAIHAGRAENFLLGGVTGAGKTEVYLHGVAEALAQGKSAILLVPEIALVPALAGTVRARFGRELAILHSALSGAERSQEWERIRRGEARVVLGPRSAVFAPVSNLGLIVVDEEQDSAFKQDKSPRYHGRDLALLRAQRDNASTVLVSATPSLETRYNVECGKLRRLDLTQRVGQGKLPEGVLVDLRQLDLVRQPGEIVFSPVLQKEIEATLARGEQAILLRNRRGYSPILLCRACGEDLRCDDCGLPRTFHKRFGHVLCHYCGSRLPAPERCVACGETALEAIGSGTERVEEKFQELFPGVAVDTLDRDAVRRRGSLTAVLDKFSRGDTQVLIGTQMVSKGHHFPQVSLAGVLHADTYLGFPDFRAVERTYGLLTQLAGRAGRGDRPGKVVIQTFHPDHYAIRAALAHDDAAFLREEMRFRRIFHYPPFTRMIQLVVQHRNRDRALEVIEELGRDLGAHPLSRGVRVMGPAPAPFERLRGKWRFQILVRGDSGKKLRSLVGAVLPETPRAELAVDVDPQELL